MARPILHGAGFPVHVGDFFLDALGNKTELVVIVHRQVAHVGTRVLVIGKVPEAFLEQVRDGLLVIAEAAGTDSQPDTPKLGLIQFPGPDTLFNFPALAGKAHHPLG